MQSSQQQLEMNYDARFIKHCEQDCDLYHYLRYLLSDYRQADFFFRHMYDSYVSTYELQENPPDYALLEFYAFEYFSDFVDNDDLSKNMSYY